MEHVHPVGIERPEAHTILFALLQEAADQTERMLHPEERQAFLMLRERVLREVREQLDVLLSVQSLQIGSGEGRHLGTYAGSEHRQVDLEGIGTVSYTALPSQHAVDRSGKCVSIFLPVRRGREKIVGALLRLQQECDRLRDAGYACHVHVCLNNSNDRSLERIMEFRHLLNAFPLHLYEVTIENPHIAGHFFSLRLLFADLQHAADPAANSEHFLHVADDDVAYPSASSGILQNIAQLREHSSVLAVSGTYVTSKRTEGFHALNALRKDHTIVRRSSWFPQVYGGALTMRAKDFPTGALPQNTSIDVYLSLAALQEQLRRGMTIDDLLHNPEQLRVRTNPHFLVEHAEEHSYRAAIWRLLRDRSWREHAAEHLGDRMLAEQLQRLRRSYYDVLTRAVDSRPAHDHSRLGQQWMRSMRDLLQDVMTRKAITANALQDVASVDPTGDTYVACTNILRNPTTVHAALSALRSSGVLSESGYQALTTPGCSEKQQWKGLVRTIAEQSSALADRQYCALPALHVLATCVQRTEKLREALLDPHCMRAVFAAAGIALTEEPQISFAPTQSAQYAVFLASGCKRYFVKYFDPLGNAYFPKRHPREAVAIHVHAEQIYAALLGAHRVVGTLYPRPRDAVLQCVSREEPNTLEQLQQHILIQDDLRASHCTLAELSGYTDEQRVAILARMLGELHGMSSGIAPCFDQPTHQDLHVMRLLQDVRPFLRNTTAAEYHRWITHIHWAVRMFRALEDHADAYPLYTHVRNHLARRDVDIQSQYDHCCSRSAQRWNAIGSMGHLDAGPNNIFCDRQDPDNFKVFDFENIAFIDPAYEAGQSLYALLRKTITNHAAVSAEGCTSLIDTFFRQYALALHAHASNSQFCPEFPSRNMSALFQDAATFSGMTLISVLAMDDDRGFTPEQRHLAEEVCIALFRQGAGYSSGMQHKR